MHDHMQAKVKLTLWTDMFRIEEDNLSLAVYGCISSRLRGLPL